MSIETQDDFDPQQFMDDHGIDDQMADREVYAHGQRLTVAEAIAKCPPFVVQIRATVEGLNDSVDDPELRKTIIANVLTRTIDRLAEDSGRVEVKADFLEPSREIAPRLS